MTIKYALKHKEKHGITNIRYNDIFTNKSIGCIINMQSNSDLAYEVENKIVCHGDYVNCICDDVARLLSARNDGLEFTDVNILLNMDMVTVCNIDFSTKYTPAIDIKINITNRDHIHV